MTRYAPQWLQSGTYAASLDRRLLGALWPAPATTGVAVTPAGTGMDVHIDPGQVAVPTPNNSGTVLCTSDAIETVTLGPAPPAGTDRVDLIVCQPRSMDLDGTSTQEDFIFAAIAGPEGAPPGTPPAVPAGTVALAQVHVVGGAASVAAGDVTDLRPFGLPVGGKAALPAPLAAGDPFRSFTADDGIVWVAKGGVRGGVWRPAVGTVRALGHATVAQHLNTGYNLLNASTVTAGDDEFGLIDVNGAFQCPMPGVYRVSGSWATTNIPQNTPCLAAIVYNGSRVLCGTQTTMGGGLGVVAHVSGPQTIPGGGGMQALGIDAEPQAPCDLFPGFGYSWMDIELVRTA